MRRLLCWAAIAALVTVAPAGARAHVGSPDAVQDGMAGPYHVLVTIRPPDVIPGIARIDVRAFDRDVSGVQVVPLPLAGPGASSPPVADVAQRSPDDEQLYGSALWLMRTGSWKIRITVDGARGSGEISLPIPALARVTRPMPRGLGVLLIGVLALLVSAAVAIIGASLREADLPDGAAPDRRRVARGRRAMAITAAALAVGLAAMRGWWNDEAAFHRRILYKPMAVAVTRPAPRTLSLSLIDSGWLNGRGAQDLLPDHGHLMHLFLVRTPALDAIAHLHPRRLDDGTFEQTVPPLPAGVYRLFGDVVHRSGLDETVTAVINLPGPNPPGAPAGSSDAERFDPDDAQALLPRAANVAAPVFTFPDGAGRLRWLNAQSLRAGQTVVLELEADGPDGVPLAGVEPYMGMAGHAMIVASAGGVFAHVHPTGSIPMAAMALVDDKPAVDHSRHHGMVFPPRIGFPYVFPRAGAYRLFVQVKVAGRVETAAWDVEVRGS